MGDKDNVFGEVVPGRKNNNGTVELANNGYGIYSSPLTDKQKLEDLLTSFGIDSNTYEVKGGCEVWPTDEFCFDFDDDGKFTEIHVLQEDM